MTFDLLRFFPDTTVFLKDHADLLSFYFPLGIIGLWRWGTWIVKKIPALLYKPARSPYTTPVSVVTAVYNEDPQIFMTALASWRRNRPAEIIAVIDYTDTASINIFKKFAREQTFAKLVITKIPGKRPALATGIRLAKNEIIALVDSDTIWTAGVVKGALSPFADPQVGGVATKQNVLTPTTVAQKIFDIQLDQRYFDEIAFLAVSGKVLTCLSGRTAFYRKQALLPVLAAMVGETFWGQPIVSGEDKCLTYLVEAAGWKTTYQSNAQVYTSGVTKLTTLLQQRLRWSRNSWRADLGALGQGWVWTHPALAGHLLDRIVQPFVVFLSPVYFLLSLKFGLWPAALMLVLWWHLSRGLKIWPHLRRRPQDMTLLPVYVISTWVFGLVKIFALFTLNHQGWVTRWNRERLPQFRFLKVAPAYAATAVVLLSLLGAVTISKQQQGIFPAGLVPFFTPAGLTRVNVLAQAPAATRVLGSATNIPETAAKVDIYEVKPGDTLSSIAANFAISLADLLVANSAVLPQWNSIHTGLLLKIPQNIPFSPLEYDYRKKYSPPLTINYQEESNTIMIEGRGNPVDLATIHNGGGGQYVKEIAAKEWLVTANIVVGKGVGLRLNGQEVTWLKLKSDPTGFVFIKSEGATIDIDGVKITSWDAPQNTVDTNDTDGRSYILAKYASLIRIRNSELAYLGYMAGGQTEATGVSWTLPERSQAKYLLSGEISASRFHHNFVGLSFTGCVGVQIVQSQVYQNLTDGISATDIRGFIIRDNTFRSNQKAGILLTQNSRQNLLAGNTIGENLTGLRLLGSPDNMIQENLLGNNHAYGIQMVNKSENNLLKHNTLEKNRIGLLLESNGNRVSKNSIRQNRTGIYLYQTASGNHLITNDTSQNQLYAVFSKTHKNSENFWYD